MKFFHLEKIKCTFFQITDYETTPRYKAKKKKKKKGGDRKRKKERKGVQC